MKILCALGILLAGLLLTGILWSVSLGWSPTVGIGT